MLWLPPETPPALLWLHTPCGAAEVADVRIPGALLGDLCPFTRGMKLRFNRANSLDDLRHAVRRDMICNKLVAQRLERPHGNHRIRVRDTHRDLCRSAVVRLHAVAQTSDKRIGPRDLLWRCLPGEWRVWRSSPTDRQFAQVSTVLKPTINVRRSIRDRLGRFQNSALYHCRGVGLLMPQDHL